MDTLIATLTKPAKVVLIRDVMDPKKKQHNKCDQKSKANEESKTKQHNKCDQKSESIEESKQKQLVQHHEFAEGEIVWARMRGFPLWPAKV